jgi:hypothetical protein
VADIRLLPFRLSDFVAVTSILLLFSPCKDSAPAP